MATSMIGCQNTPQLRWPAIVGAGLAWLLTSTSSAAQPTPPTAAPPTATASAATSPTATAAAPTAKPTTQIAPTKKPAAIENAPACTPDQVHIAGRSPAQLLQIARSYAALADHSGDPWDAVLALAYFERSRAINPKLAQRRLKDTMARMRQLAGRRPYQPPIAGVRYPVYFSAYNREEQFEVDAPTGHCTTPCTLAMPLGPQVVTASGDGDIETEIFVSAGLSRVRFQEDSSTEKVAGTVLIPTGFLVGATLWALGIPCSRDTGCFLANIIGWPVVGTAMIITGIGLLAGADDLPIDANRLERVGLAPLLTPGPAGQPQMTGVVGSLTATF